MRLLTLKKRTGVFGKRDIPCRRLCRPKPSISSAVCWPKTQCIGHTSMISCATTFSARCVSLCGNETILTSSHTMKYSVALSLLFFSYIRVSHQTDCLLSAAMRPQIFTTPALPRASSRKPQPPCSEERRTKPSTWRLKVSTFTPSLT